MASLDGITVLCVADNSIYRDWIATALREHGALVHACSSSADDLASWIGKRPIASIDIAVIDLDARGGRGVEVALALSEYRTPQWPWIGLTHREDHVQRAAARVGRATSLLPEANARDAIPTAIHDAFHSAPGSTKRDRQLAYARHMYGLDDDEVACARGILDEETNRTIARRHGFSLAHLTRKMSSLQEKLRVFTREGVAAKIADMPDSPTREVPAFH